MLADIWTEGVPIGTPAPDFNVIGPDGEAVALSDLRGQPVVLVFSRGHWDPARSHQLALYDQVLEQVHGGGRVLSVSCEGLTCAFELKAETLSFPLVQGLSSNAELAKKYGVEGKQAVIVLDENGIVRWSHVAPLGIHPSPDALVEVLNEMSENPV